MLKKRYLTGKMLAGITLGICCAGLSAQQYEREIQLAQELNEINLQDYAQMLIDKLLAEPGNQNNELLLAQKAQNFVAQGKMGDAMKLINALPKDSPAYYNAKSGIGIFFVRQRKFADGIPMLMEVKEYAVKNNCLANYKPALLWLLTACQDQGKAAEAQELLMLLDKADNADTERSRREMLLAQTRYGLSCIENMKTTFDEKYAALKEELEMKKKAAASAKKANVNGLQGAINNAWNNYKRALDGGNAGAAATHGANYLNAYRNMAKAIGMDESAAVEFANMDKIKRQQPGRLNLIKMKRSQLNAQQKNVLAIKDNNDWQDIVYQALLDMEEVQWGGLDACFFMAAANIMQAYYHLGEYQAALTVYRKNQSVFVQCDEEYKKNNQPIENSPTADARMWEGYSCLGLAKQLEAKKDTKGALQYYKRAFVAFGQLLMRYPKHQDGAKNYPVLLEVVEKLKKLDPGMSAALDKQLVRVPKPELKQTVQQAEEEIVELVPPLPAQEFRDGSTIAAENLKKDRTDAKSTDADWAACRKHFEVVDRELRPIMQGNRLSTGLPKVMNHLLIANGYLGKVFDFRALVQLSEFMMRDNDSVHHGIAVGANALWMYAERAEATGAHEVARRLQDETMKVYDTFLRIAPSHPYAPNVAIRLASVEFIRANEIGLLINEKQKANAPQEEIEALEKERIAGFDRALARFNFIFNNFSHRKEFVDKSYELAIESYRLTDRLLEAANMCDKFCEAGSADPHKIIKAKVDTASHLYGYMRNKKLAENIKKLSQRIEANKGVEPQRPADLSEDILKLLEKAKDADAKDADAKDADAKDVAKKEDKDGDAKPQKKKVDRKLAAALEAKKKYDAEMAKYDYDLASYNARQDENKRLQKELDLLSAEQEKHSKRACEAVEMLNSWLQEGGQYQKQANTDRVKKEQYRADTIYPWLLEGAGEIQKCCDEFEKVIAKYEKDELAKQKADPSKTSFVPGYLMKVGSLYTSHLDNVAKAEKVFEKLTRDYPGTKEAQEGEYYFAKALFDGKKYDLAFRKFANLMSDEKLKETLTVSKYREISEKLLTCTDKTLLADAAELSFSATQQLLEMLKANIKLEDWVGESYANILKNDQQQLIRYLDIMRGRLNMSLADAGLLVANEAQKKKDTQKETEFLKKVLNAYLTLLPDKDRNTSTSSDYYKIIFDRADIRRRLKDYDNASKDLIAASRRANAAGGGDSSDPNRPPNMVGYYYKAQNMLGKLYLEMNDLKKSHAAFMIIAALNYKQPTKLSDHPKYKELEDQATEAGKEAMEEAIYMGAVTANMLGDAKRKKEMADKYIGTYPNGKFINQARELAR